MSDQTPDWPYPDIPPPPPRLQQPRQGSSHLYLSPPNQRDRDVWAAERRHRNGWEYQQIADALGLSSKSAAFEAVTRGRRTPDAEREQRAAELREMLRERLELLTEAATQVLERKHVTVSHGKVIVVKDEETGKEVPLLDDGPVLQAIDRLLRINESYRKLDGLDQPTKVEHSGGVKYEIVGINPEDLT